MINEVTELLKIKFSKYENITEELEDILIKEAVNEVILQKELRKQNKEVYCNGI